MTNAEKYFTAAINSLPKGVGVQHDPEKTSLYWGLLELAKQVQRIEAAQEYLGRQIAAVERTVAARR